MADFAVILGVYFAFLNLAKSFRRTRWKTVLSGIAVYLVANVMLNLILTVFMNVNPPTTSNAISLKGWVVLISGIFITYLFYAQLKKRFVQDERNSPNREIDKIGSGKY